MKINPRSILICSAFVMQAIGWAGLNEWTSLGPDGGGAYALVVDPQTPSTVYALTPAGIFKTTDGGAGWHTTGALPPADVPSFFPKSLAIDPQNSTTLYAARESGGVLKSTDGGARWNAVNSGLIGPLPGMCVFDPQNPTCQNLPTQPARVSYLAIDPENSSTVYAATGYGGVFKTTDGGAKWSAVNSGIPIDRGIPILSVTIDPGNPRTVYATAVGDLFKSSDGGASWSVMNSNLRIGGCFEGPPVVVDPQNSATLYAGCSGLLKSTDGGATWNSVSSRLPGSVVFLVIDPQNTQTLYAATGTRVFKSTDGGATWRDTGLSISGRPALGIDPKNPSTVYAATYYSSDFSAGAFKSTDGGEHWSAINSGLRAIGIGPGALLDGSEVLDVIYSQAGATLYGNLVNPAPGGAAVIKSTDGGTTWSPLNVARLLAVDPQDTATLYAIAPAYQDGLSKSIDGGVSWMAPAKAGLPEDSCHAVSTLAIDPQNTSTWYAGISILACVPTAGDGVYKSTDGGASWTRFDALPSGDGVNGLAIDPQNTSIVYAWNEEGLFKSTDSATSWVELKASGGSGQPGVPLLIFRLAINPQSPGTLYAATGGGVLKSTDGGANWSAANSGLSAISVNGTTNYAATTVAIDPQNTSTVYAATGAGVFRSTDEGANWSAVNSGLTTFAVAALAVDPQNPNTVYAGTAGGVFAITFGGGQ